MKVKEPGNKTESQAEGIAKPLRKKKRERERETILCEKLEKTREEG